MDQVSSTARPKLTFWVVAVLSLLWNLIGAYDYLMTRTHNMEYLQGAGMGPEELAYMDSFPLWANIGWGLGVWGAVAGSVLLLVRNRWAYHAFAVSLLGLVMTTVHTYAFPHPAIFDGAMAMMFSAVLAAVAIALLLFARRSAADGVLR